MKVAQNRRWAMLASALDSQSQLLAAIAAELRSESDEDRRSSYVDQHSSPLSKRVYLTLARRGAFPTKRVGKRVLADREVFERWLASTSTAPKRSKPASTKPTSLDDAVLAELGARKAVSA